MTVPEALEQLRIAVEEESAAAAIKVTDAMVAAAHEAIEQSYRTESWEFGPPSSLARSILTAALRVSEDRSREPLKWSDPYPDEKPYDLYVSATQGLVYHARKADRWNVTVTYWDSGEPRQVGSFDTLEQAKAAAQADYEQCILSAIEAPAALKGDRP